MQVMGKYPSLRVITDEIAGDARSWPFASGSFSGNLFFEDPLSRERRMWPGKAPD